jgi:two-component system cell cycle response regulator DivK
MGKRILIVEDEDDNLNVLTQILEFMLDQHDLLVARDGHEAIRMAYDHHPDIILMDLTLPKLSGWECTRSLRSDDKFNNTPILAITAHAMIGDREEALKAGCDDYFSKPIEIDAFIKFIKPYLSSSQPSSVSSSEED